MTLLSAANSTRVLAILSFTAAILFYQHEMVGRLPQQVNFEYWSSRSSEAGEKGPNDTGQTQTETKIVQNSYIEEYNDAKRLEDIMVQNMGTNSQIKAAKDSTKVTNAQYGSKRKSAADSNSEETNAVVNHLKAKNDAVNRIDTKTNAPVIAVPVPLLTPSNGSALTQIDLSTYSKKEQALLRRRLRILQKRAQRVSDVCSKRPLLQRPGDLHLVWDVKRSPSILFCPIYKVGSTSWMINFLRLAHFNEDNPELLKLPPRKRKALQFKAKYGATQGKAHELFPAPAQPEERERVFRESLRMVVVRHPFTRLISAYRDKMTKLNPRPPEHKFRELQRHIISQYRPRNTTEQSPFPTFAEFAQHVIDSTQNLHTREQWVKNVRCWRPYWVECNICAADYNLILKLESSKPDFNFVVTLARMEELKKIGNSEWRHLNNNTSSSDLLISYYSQLTRYQIQQLKLRYLLDFELFGYGISPKVMDSAKD